MTYAAALEYLFARLPMFSRIGAAAYKKDLTNTRRLCAFLGDPQKRFRSIHVGGTNGKGSVSHMLAAVLQEAGYKTGLYTSPHLYDFRERIRVNGMMADEAFVIAFTERMMPLIEEIHPSFFEITVAMAFEWFALQQVEVAVIEVGLGGRLDSTNIIDPVLSVISNIGWDHMNLLGDTLESIAGEKAGIIKQGVPVVIGQWQGGPSEVLLEKAATVGASCVIAGHRWGVRTLAETPQLRRVEIYDRYGADLFELDLDLPGLYQEQNVRTAWTALLELRRFGFAISDDALRQGLFQVRSLTGLMGRWEVLREQPLVVLDVAHNKDGLAQLRQQLTRLSFAKLHLVFGMVRDKEPQTMLPLLPTCDHYYFTQAHIPRALPADELVAAAAEAGRPGRSYPDVNSALAAALQSAAPDDLVLVCGSIFLVAEVNRECFGSKA